METPEPPHSESEDKNSRYKDIHPLDDDVFVDSFTLCIKVGSHKGNNH